jgi:hypothetical protein
MLRLQDVLGPDHEETLDYMQWLGKPLYHQRRYGEADMIFQETLERQERVLLARIMRRPVKQGILQREPVER